MTDIDPNISNVTPLRPKDPTAALRARRYRLRKKIGTAGVPRLKGGGRKAKHGHTRHRKRSPEHQAWQNMKDRCLNPNNPQFHLWGGRGITIYQPWIDSFEAFFAYVGPRPSPKHELDRIDPDGDYVPGNVIWATHKEASAHTRQAHQIPVPDGRKVTLTQMSRELGLHHKKLQSVVDHAKTSIVRGARSEDVATRVGI